MARGKKSSKTPRKGFDALMPRVHKIFSKETKNKKREQARKNPSQRQTAFDYFVNQLARMGWGTASITEATTYELVRLSNNYWLMLTFYRNHWLARRIVDLPAIDMTRAWPKLLSDLEPDDIEHFQRTIRRTYTPGNMRKSLKWARLYGGAGALIAIKGHEDILDQPLDLDDVNPGTYLGLIPFDRWVGIWPEGAVEDNLAMPNEWGLPEYYYCQKQDRGEGFRVHRSRILRSIGPDIPTPELQAQMYWGLSVLEIVFEELRKKDNASWSILQLLFRANVISQTNPELAQLLSGLGASSAALQRYQQVIEAQNQMLSNNSMLILGKEGRMDSLQYSFGGIGEVYAQFQMDCSGAAEIPVTRLFGRTITGLGQSNDADERYYEETIAQKQDEDLRPNLDKLYPTILMSELGEVPEDWDVAFPSIRVLTEEDKSDLVQKASAPVLAAFDSGVIGRKTALKELREMGDRSGIFTNITEEDIEKAEEEPELPGEDLLAGLGGSKPGLGKPKSPQSILTATGAKAGGGDSAFDAHPLQGRRIWHGLDISIENKAGSVRNGKDRDGKSWSVRMTHDYGYIRKTEGVDGDHIDVFLGDHPDSELVYVIHTKKAPDFREYDEDKCMLDFASETSAKNTFLANYTDSRHFGSMDVMGVGKFIDKVLASRENPQMIAADSKFPKGEVVPEGGSNCSKCKYQSKKDPQRCTNKLFIAWDGSKENPPKPPQSDIIPAAPERYCSNWFIAKPGLIQIEAELIEA